MKKLICLILPLILLTACSRAPAIEMADLKNDSRPADTVQEEEPETLRYQVRTEVWADTACAEDGTPLAKYSFQLPELMVLHADGTALETAETELERQAAAVAETFNTHFGKWAAAEEFDDLTMAAEEDLLWHREEDLEWFGGYTLELATSVYQTDRLVSVTGSYYSDTGGAHPNTWQLGWNYDLISGVFFSPEELAEDGAVFQQAILGELIRQADAIAAENEMEPEVFFWADYPEILANWSSYAVSFDEDGMTVAFSPYELACYAAGTQVFSISYEWLSLYLSEHGREVLGLTAE